jgi:hypothetical protein
MAASYLGMNLHGLRQPIEAIYGRLWPGVLATSAPTAHASSTPDRQHTTVELRRGLVTIHLLRRTPR